MRPSSALKGMRKHSRIKDVQGRARVDLRDKKGVEKSCIGSGVRGGEETEIGTTDTKGADSNSRQHPLR